MAGKSDVPQNAAGHEEFSRHGMYALARLPFAHCGTAAQCCTLIAVTGFANVTGMLDARVNVPVTAGVQPLEAISWLVNGDEPDVNDHECLAVRYSYVYALSSRAGLTKIDLFAPIFDFSTSQ